MAHVDYFLKLQGVEGESDDSKHSKEIDILSWSWGETNSGHFAAQSGGGTGKVSMQDVHFTAKMNKATPALMQACAGGKHIPSGILTCRKPTGDGGQQDYLIIKLTDILVSSYQTGGAMGGDVIPTDAFALNFAKIELEYKVQKADGSLSAGGNFGWDQKKNVKV